MRISIIGGTGNQGKGLALRLGKAGYPIYLGSRSKEKAAEAVREIKEIHPEIEIEGFDNFQAAGLGDLVIFTIPYKTIKEVIPNLRSQVKGKVVVDTSVALIPGKPPTVEKIQEGSVAQKIQGYMGNETHVVSAFHTISAHLLNNLAEPLNGDTLVAGDNQEAKEIVMELASKLGLRPLDAGPLGVSHVLEDLTALSIGLNMRYKRKSIGVRFTGLETN